jgi:hypothetical protein
MNSIANPNDLLQPSTRVYEKRTDITSCRGCNNNLAGNDPASQYQRQKIIQNTVRVSASLYTMNLAGLSVYRKPLKVYQQVEQAGTIYVTPPSVNWNQMSDRSSPSIQKYATASGSTYHGSSYKRSIVRHRPGANNPGGTGCDIKHNSYNRYLNRLKGKAPYRTGVIPPGFGLPIPFNRAYPIYGGKIIKTGIINNCDCPNVVDNFVADKRIYGSELNAIQDKILAVGYKYNVGDFVWAKKVATDSLFYKAQIISINNDMYTIKFVDDGLIITTNVYGLLIYFDCNCMNSSSAAELVVENQNNLQNISAYITSESNLACGILNLLAASEIL